MSQIQDQIRSTALRYGVDPALALAVAQQESSFNQGARGAAGEVGVFQLMPGTAADLGVNPYDQTQNIEGGISYLAQLYRQFGDWAKALAAYNGGPGNMARGTTPASSWDYAQSVLASAEVYGPQPVTEQPQLASFIPDLGISNWVWFAGLGAVGLALLLKRD
jgi:soluble lytic murein transglycosylase-like protein